MKYSVQPLPHQQESTGDIESGRRIGSTTCSNVQWYLSVFLHSIIYLSKSCWFVSPTISLKFKESLACV